MKRLRDALGPLAGLMRFDASAIGVLEDEGLDAPLFWLAVATFFAMVAAVFPLLRWVSDRPAGVDPQDILVYGGLVLLFAICLPRAVDLPLHWAARALGGRRVEVGWYRLTAALFVISGLATLALLAGSWIAFSLTERYGVRGRSAAEVWSACFAVGLLVLLGYLTALQTFSVLHVHRLTLAEAIGVTLPAVAPLLVIGAHLIAHAAFDDEYLWTTFLWLFHTLGS